LVTELWGQVVSKSPEVAALGAAEEETGGGAAVPGVNGEEAGSLVMVIQGADVHLHELVGGGFGRCHFSLPDSSFDDQKPYVTIIRVYMAHKSKAHYFFKQGQILYIGRGGISDLHQRNRADNKEKMMIVFENSISIERPIAEVFAFLSDFENIPKWNYYVLKVKKTSDGPEDVETTYYQVRQTDEQNFCITEFALNHKIAVRTLPGSSPQFERRFTLEAKGKTTQIRDEWKLDTGKPALIEKLALGKVRSAVAENLSKLKELLETGSVTLQDGRTVSL